MHGSIQLRFIWGTVMIRAPLFCKHTPKPHEEKEILGLEVVSVVFLKKTREKSNPQNPRNREKSENHPRIAENILGFGGIRFFSEIKKI